MAGNARDITALLKAWEGGEAAALDELTPLVYDHLRKLAGRYVRHERAGNSLQTTALVHEAYLRLVRAEDAGWHDRVHFFAVCARIMRRILVDHARKRASAKRGGTAMAANRRADVNLDDLPATEPERADELCALDDALVALAALDARRAQVIELRFFGGLSVEETAAALEVSPQTVMRDWKLARAWLTRELRQA
jgi:RNA polymerase sigma factor (TIGR02999 family)